METSTHRNLGLAAALVASHYHPLPALGIAVSAAAAWLCSGGVTSPDLDNQAKYKALDTLLPDEWLGRGGPLGHRRLLHWWGLPALAWLLWAGWQPEVPDLVAWAFLGALIGWSSHLLGDFVFGQRNGRVGLQQGIPLLPWWAHVGVGLKADGALQRGVGVLSAVVALWAAVTSAPWLAEYWVVPLMERYLPLT